MVPKYSKTVKGKHLSITNGVFKANGEVLWSEPTHNPNPNFANCEPPRDADLKPYVQRSGEEAVESGLHPLKLRLDARSLDADATKAMLSVAIASPYRQIELVTTPSTIPAIPQAFTRYVTTFEFHSKSYEEDVFHGVFVRSAGLWKKSRVIAPTATLAVPQMMEMMFKYQKWGVRSVDLEPEGSGDLDWWLMYAGRLVHSLRGGHTLKYFSFDGVAAPMSDMFYRIDRHKDGGDAWEHYANSPEQFDAAFWAYSELHQHISAIERERRSLS